MDERQKIVDNQTLLLEELYDIVDRWQATTGPQMMAMAFCSITVHICLSECPQGKDFLEYSIKAISEEWIKKNGRH